MEFKAKITKKFMFELSLEEIKAIETISNLIEYIEDTLDNYAIDTNRLTLDSLDSDGETVDYIAYDDFIAMKRELEFLNYSRRILIEEDIEEQM